MSLPLKTVERILREAGAVRVSRSASQELAAFLERFVSKLSKEAFEIAEHSGRKTVTDSDILLARKRLQKI
ncbi:MAG: histone [Candidatus Aenigmatarchaeota archaeon]|nr:MAG: histone [Candidatus Aenigmarchaeota archaeon]